MCKPIRFDHFSYTLRPSTDAKKNPEKGLSLSQLVLALNQEPKCASYPPSHFAEDYRYLGNDEYSDLYHRFSFHDVSQLDQDTSIASSSIRKRNSFVDINRIPVGILSSMIPSHLSPQGECLHASFACHHWRGTFLQRAELWSEMIFLKWWDLCEPFPRLFRRVCSASRRALMGSWIFPFAAQSNVVSNSDGIATHIRSATSKCRMYFHDVNSSQNAHTECYQYMIRRNGAQPAR